MKLEKLDRDIQILHCCGIPAFVWAMTKILGWVQEKDNNCWYSDGHLGKRPNLHLYTLEDQGS